MTVDFIVDVPGQRRVHALRVMGELTPGRPAPNVRDHDAPGFADPGEGTELYLTAAWLTLGRREKRLPLTCVTKLQNDGGLMDDLYRIAMAGLPRA